MKVDWPFTKWPAIHIPAEADEDACTKALIMRAGGYEKALRALKRNRDWLKPLKRDVDDRVLLDIAHCNQVNSGFTDNAALTELANKAYGGKAAVAALRRLRYILRRDPLHRFWWKRWSRFLER